MNGETFVGTDWSMPSVGWAIFARDIREDGANAIEVGCSRRAVFDCLLALAGLICRPERSGTVPDPKVVGALEFEREEVYYLRDPRGVFDWAGRMIRLASDIEDIDDVELRWSDEDESVVLRWADGAIPGRFVEIEVWLGEEVPVFLATRRDSFKRPLGLCARMRWNTGTGRPSQTMKKFTLALEYADEWREEELAE